MPLPLIALAELSPTILAALPPTVVAAAVRPTIFAATLRSPTGLCRVVGLVFAGERASGLPLQKQARAYLHRQAAARVESVDPLTRVAEDSQTRFVAVASPNTSDE